MWDKTSSIRISWRSPGNTVFWALLVEFLVQRVWGRACESAFLTSSRGCGWSGEHTRSSSNKTLCVLSPPFILSGRFWNMQRPDGTSGDIFLRELWKLKAEKGSCGRGPQRARVLLLNCWGQNHLSSNLTQRVPFFIQKQHGE